MDLAAIKMECRAVLDDTIEPYLFTDEQLELRINEAMREACTRADLITDSTTPEICEIEIQSGVNQYALNPLIKEILVAKLGVTRRPLGASGYKRQYDDHPDWMTRSGKPDAYVLDYETNQIILSHRPEEDDLLRLTVRRLPTQDLTGSNDVPPFKAEYHYDLIWWAIHLCYLTRDSDVYDPRAAEQAEAKFARRFGRRPTAEDMEHKLRNYPRRARAQFI